MHVAGHPYNVLSNTQVSLIHHSALHILEEMGMEIQNQDLLHVFAAAGLPVDFQAQRVRFPAQAVERYIAEADKYDWENHKPSISSTADVYHSQFHDPETMELVPWTEERLAYYFRLAHRMPHVDEVSMLGSRLYSAPELEPLFERYYCWKYGAREGSSVFLDELCPYLLELYQMRAAAKKQPLAEVFRATVYLVPALRIGKHEAYQVAYFRERGLRVRVGDMYAMGATSPATLAGSTALNIAEQLALHIFNRVLFDDRQLHLGCSVAPMDMRTSMHTLGRPEMTLANILNAQMARFYGASASGHTALTDAKYPSVEVGAQKAMGAVATLLAVGSLWVDAGLLSNDEIMSPVQLILDNEMIGALKQYIHEFDIDEESIGLETILEAGPGGMYLDKMHTAQHYRKEFWQPSIWTREMLIPWQQAGAKIDVERARQQALDVMHNTPQEVFLSDAEDQDILKLIEHTRQKLSI